MVWRGARNAAFERVSVFHVHAKGGIVIRHRQLEGDNKHVKLHYGIHLNKIGMDIFLSGLQDGIERALFVLVCESRCLCSGSHLTFGA